MNTFVSARRQTRIWHAITAVGLAALLASSAQAAPGKRNVGQISYSGQATALKIDGVINPVPGQILLCDTGPLPATGGHIQVTKSNFSYAGGALTVEHASAMTMGGGPEAFSNSSLTGYRVEFEEDGHRALIEADYVYGEASASVEKNGKITLNAKVVIQGLKVNGQTITVTGQPNQRVELPPEVGGYLILNEQVNAADGASGDIAVSPIHFFVCHCVEGHVGLVRAGITSTGNPPPPEDCGKVTGGGWITGTPSGAKGTFGVSGGIRAGAYWGHLTYNDHGASLKVHSNSVTNFQLDPADANARIITYACTINGVAGTATVRVVDHGEPGRNDLFSIRLSTGYQAAGDLGGGRPGGGNIQNHKCPPGWR